MSKKIAAVKRCDDCGKKIPEGRCKATNSCLCRECQQRKEERVKNPPLPDSGGGSSFLASVLASMPDEIESAALDQQRAASDAAQSM